MLQAGAAGTQQLAGAGAQYFGEQAGAQHEAGAGQHFGASQQRGAGQPQVAGAGQHFGGSQHRAGAQHEAGAGQHFGASQHRGAAHGAGAQHAGPQAGAGAALRRFAAPRSGTRSRSTARWATSRSRAAVRRRRARSRSAARGRSRSTALGRLTAAAAAGGFLTSTLPLVAMHCRATRLHDDRFAATGLTAARAATALAAPVMVPPMEQVVHVGLCGSGHTESGDHGATDSHPFHDAESPSLGIRIRGPSPSVGDVPAKCSFVGPRAQDLVRKSGQPGDARRVIPSYRPQSRRLRRQNVSTTQGAPSCGPCWARVPHP